MTSCCRFVVRYGFLTLDLNRIQIAAGTDNARSRAIPERLGFKLEGILRGRERPLRHVHRSRDVLAAAQRVRRVSAPTASPR